MISFSEMMGAPALQDQFQQFMQQQNPMALAAMMGAGNMFRGPDWQQNMPQMPQPMTPADYRPAPQDLPGYQPPRPSILGGAAGYAGGGDTAQAYHASRLDDGMRNFDRQLGAPSAALDDGMGNYDVAMGAGTRGGIGSIGRSIGNAFGGLFG